jgi:hypothetical protein
MGIPVEAPLVGGAAEALDDSRGHPFGSCEDIAGYVQAVECVKDDYEDAARRARAAREFIDTEFS